MQTQTINVNGRLIHLKKIDNMIYLCLTNIVNRFPNINLNYIMPIWLARRETFELIKAWEEVYNPKFTPTESNNDNNSASLSFLPQNWKEQFIGTGLVSCLKECNGNFFIHVSIGIIFCTWLSSDYAIYIVKALEVFNGKEVTL